MRGVKIDNIQRSFSHVKRDIEQLNKRNTESSDGLSALKGKVDAATTKEQFYDFIRELNDELRKLERSVASQDSVDRLRAELHTHISNLKERLEEASGKLSRLTVLDDRTAELRTRVNALEALNKRLESFEKNYVDWQGFYKKTREVVADEGFAELESLKGRIDERFNETRKGIAEMNRVAATRADMKSQRDFTSRTFREQSAIIREQAKRIERLEKQMGKATPKVIEGKPGLIERGLNRVSDRFHIFPLVLLIIIAIALVVGLVFFREDIFSPTLFKDAQSLDCQQRFECKPDGKGSFLVDCKFDEALGDCHCSAKPFNLSGCPKQ